MEGTSHSFQQMPKNPNLTIELELVKKTKQGILPPMLVDGTRIAQDILREIQNQITHMAHTPHAIVCTCAPNFETKRYLKMKQVKAKQVGIELEVVTFPEGITTVEMVEAIQHLSAQTDAIIVQLPLPVHIDTDTVLQTIHPQCDADGVHYNGTSDTVLPPVVGAIVEIAHRFDVLFASLNVVVVGQGRLVGLPVSTYMQTTGAKVTVLTEDSKNSEGAIAQADVLVLGAGVPALIAPDKVKEGVIIFDAGTSESNGVLVGDAHPDCEKKASLLTPVPGGIGPITIALLLRNIVELQR